MNTTATGLNELVKGDFNKLKSEGDTVQKIATKLDNYKIMQNIGEGAFG